MGKALTNDVEDELQKLLVVDKLRRKEGWYETRESRFGSYAVFLLQPHIYLVWQAPRGQDVCTAVITLLRVGSTRPSSPARACGGPAIRPRSGPPHLSDPRPNIDRATS